MTRKPAPTNLRAEAEAFTIEDLVARVRRGHVRVPTFQRGLRWGSDDVVALFDSVYRGYPIGSLLLRKGDADAAQIVIGPLAIDAPATHSGLWVIDGQQRLTALTAGLFRPGDIPRTPDDPYVVYFDAQTKTFTAPPRDGTIANTWVPVAQLLDSSALTEWVYNWPNGNNPSLRTAVFEAGARIRSYRVPLYTVETTDETLLRDIFYRINNYGKSLEWDEVHDALFGRTGEHPSSIRELADDLDTLGMGRPEEGQLVPCLVAFKGLDVTRSIADHYRKDPAALRNAVQDALPAIRGALLFLRSHAEVPHLRLLPRTAPLVVLTRFLAVYPDPKPRTLDLLVRWTWRTLLDASAYDERTLLRHAITHIGESDEESSIQALLKLVPGRLVKKFQVPERYDARAADSRLALLGLASLHPVHLQSGHRVNVAELIEAQDADAFRKIVPAGTALVRSPANRILTPGTGSALNDVRRFADDETVLVSHAISRIAVKALVANDRKSFLVERGNTIERAVNALAERLTGAARSDRPSIAYLLRMAEA